MFKHRTLSRALGVLTFVLISPCTSSQARDIEAPAVDVLTITNEAAESRVLLDVPALPEIRGELVISAFLELTLPGVAPARSIPILVHRITTPWRGLSPSWNSPWRNAGGDFHEIAAPAQVIWKGESRTRMTFDVTEMVRDMADGEAEECGFLLTVPEERGKGFRASELESLGSLAGAQLRVTTRPIAHLGFSNSRDMSRGRDSQ